MLLEKEKIVEKERDLLYSIFRETMKKEDKMYTSQTVIWSGKTYEVNKGGFIIETGPYEKKYHSSPFSIEDISARLLCEDAIRNMKNIEEEEARLNLLERLRSSDD